MKKVAQWALNHWLDAVTAKRFLNDQVSYQDVWWNLSIPAEELDDKIIEWLKLIKYESYISKAMDQVEKMKRMEENEFQQTLTGMTHCNQLIKNLN